VEKFTAFENEERRTVSEVCFVPFWHSVYACGTDNLFTESQLILLAFSPNLSKFAAL